MPNTAGARWAILYVILAGVTVGCATHGDLVTLREDVQKEMAATRAHLNERIDQAADQLEAKKKALHEQTQQALSELKNQMQNLGAIQTKLKDLHATGERQQKALDDLKQQMVTLTAAQAGLKDVQQQLDMSRQAVQEVKTKLDALHKDRLRLQALIQALEENLIRSFKAEQVELRDRLKTLDQSVKDLEHMGGINTAPALVTTKP